MPDLLLSLCPPWPASCPPLAIASLATYVRKHGYDVSLYDLNARMLKHARHLGEHAGAGFDVRHYYLPEGAELPDAWNFTCWETWRPPYLQTLLSLFQEDLAQFLNLIDQQRPAVVGFSCYRENLSMSKEMAQLLRERHPAMAIIFGGPCLPGELDPSELDLSVVDAFVMGEGEIVLEEILAAMRRGGREEVRSLTAASPFLPGKPLLALDALPPLRYNGLDLSFYEPGKAHVITSRGCVNSCNFCSDRLYHRGFRSHGVEHVLAELRYLTGELRCTELFMFDLTFNAQPERLQQLCYGIFDQELSFSWTAMAYMNKGITPELLQLMKGTGCKALIFGMESGSDHVLSLMNKPFRTDEARRVLRDTTAAGIGTLINLIVGYPGEQEAHIEETIQFLKTERQHISAICFLSLYHLIPNTQTWLHREQVGILPQSPYGQNWEASDGNTLAVRYRRGKLLQQVCEDIGIPVENPPLKPPGI